ncbi:MAG TPA: SUMF1/EgtB/PvdO family nonheme iron enzyme [Treponemataceae bacterium]|nr:SUMF1/EgtB/PvdO family nonheme iron enzyme [Treponemataceae bacterium]
MKPVPTDGSFKTNESTGILDLKIDNLTGLAGKTQVYAFDIEFAGAYEIDAEFNDDGNDSFAYLNIYDVDGKKVDESEDIYNLKSGKYFFVVSIPENATNATFTVEKVEETQTADFITMLLIPAGSFQRDDDERKISVITKPYYMSEYQITRQQFEEIMGEDPSYEDSSSGMSDPVQYVNWYHAIAFCNKLSLKEGLEPVYTVSVVSNWANLDFSSIPTSSNANWDAAECNWKANGYRLPTEMEWMWAAMGADQDARAGAMQNGINTTGYTKNYAGEGHDTGTSIDDYAWHNNNSGDNGASENRKTHPVGEKLPNELGLYDMSGNVNEWCWDWKADYQTDTLTDYRGADSGSSRVLRGGSWDDSAFFCTVAFQNVGNPYHQDSAGGFRVLRPVQSP